MEDNYLIVDSHSHIGIGLKSRYASMEIYEQMQKNIIFHILY